MKVWSILVLQLFAAAYAEVTVLILEGVGGWSQADHQGQGDILWQTFEESGPSFTDFSHTHLPLSRGIMMFSKGEYDCVFLGNTREVKRFTGVDTTPANAVTSARIHIATHVDSPTISSMQDMAGKTMAVLEGVSIYEDDVLMGVHELQQVFYAPSLNVVHQMVEQKRADMLAWWLPRDGEQTPPFLHYDKNFTFYESSRTLNCRPERAGTAELIDAFNQFLNTQSLDF